ncbi:uncharacterized protein LOC129942587 [Eupeodes corollae]|uniref:uncharacterized protein LOC129942587 n=1 Tax=Eupeodes corollae TaxID=290404 RepID=UPI00248F4C56|nr:uncharacterized protein LOC129942587 [Eupeodes corollae]XP_055907567.1 uncharacterized protein LOC129942587 [Eupeodes corollae]
MAMFLFSYNELVFLLIVYSFVIIQHGLITNNITVGASLGNIVIAANFLQIKRPPVTRLLISQPNVPHYLPCSASINYDPHENTVPVKRLIYIWYRNGIELKTLKQANLKHFEVLKNGTLRLPINQKATGVYKCLVNATTSGHHYQALLSESCSVEYPVLKRIPIHYSNLTALPGMPITLSCPVQSIPTANVTWLHENISIERKLKENRFIILTNGSLVLRNLTETDRGEYKCIARNTYAEKKHRQFRITINVEPPNITNNSYKPSPSKYKLLPPLQDDVHYIPSGTNLRLRCFGTSNSITIEWWFGKSLDLQPKNLSNNSRDFHIRDAKVLRDDGFYRCSTKDDSQVFQVIVTEPPVILQPLDSYESALAAFVNYSCSAEGNPKPEFSWYHNGRPISKDSYTTNVDRNVLTIKSFDIANVGIYQCFAKNIAGETYSAALLRLSKREDLKIMPDPLKNVQCYAMNFDTINVTFQSATSLFLITVHFVQKNPFRWETKPLLQLHNSQHVVISGQMPTYEPFVILIRALLPISSTRYNKESVEETMQSSFLSEPAFCCTQGLPIRAFHLTAGVFITWSKPMLETKYFIIQFSIALTRPHPYEFFKDSRLQGISSSVTIMTVPKDIENNLKDVIPLDESQARDVLSRAQVTSNDSEDDEDVFSIIVPSNVTGLLLKNCQIAKIRVLIITNENENLQQDFRFVQWKIIENDTQETTLVPFRVQNVEPRSISFTFNESFEDKCVRVCYFAYEIRDFGTSRPTCEDMTITSLKLVLRHLKPRKQYKALFSNCTNYLPYGEADVQTVPDPPGTVTNHKVANDGGLKLSWDPPTNANGKIYYYSVFWTVNNATHGANVSSSETFFKFPNITEREEVNVTVRVVGENGIGAPIFFDLRNWSRNTDDGRRSILDTYLGVAIGGALSTLCILVFSLIFICQRHRFKMRSGQIQLTSQSESNIGAASTPGGNTETTGLGGFLGDGGLSGGLGDSSALHEYHEMRTLIPKSQQYQYLRDMPQSPKQQLPNGNGNCPRRNDNSSECIFAETELDEEPTSLSSSTPLSKVPPQRRISKDDAPAALYFIPVAAATTKNHRKNNIEVEYANPKKLFSDRFTLNKISSSPNFFNSDNCSSVSGGCRPLARPAEDCSRQRHTNRHSQQRQPFAAAAAAATQNGCSHYVNTTNNRNSYSSSSNNSKPNQQHQQQPPSQKHQHPIDQLNHSIDDNGVASLSEPKLFATINNGERNPDSKNHALFPDDTERLFEHTQFHPINSSTLDRNNDGQMKMFRTSPASAAINNNNTLSWNSKQKQPISNNDDEYDHRHRHNSSVAPLIRNNSTIGSEASSSSITNNVDDHPSSSSPDGIAFTNHHHHHHQNNYHHNHHDSDNSINNPLLKTNWNHRRPNVDPNG